MKSSGFEAVAGLDARVLILGTLPGAASIAKGQYYAQPRNAFWSIMGAVVDAGPNLPYEERLDRLVARRIALWDVCARAMRPGSLDSAIQAGSVEANDFGRFFELHPELRLVCFNGGRAAALFQRFVLPGLGVRWTHIRRSTLPSTSPAHASMPLRQKVQAWRAGLTGFEA